MKARVCDERDRDAFDAYVAASPFGDVLQSWEWGEVKARYGWEVTRRVVEDGGRIVAAASIHRTRPVPLAPAILYAPRGPIFDDARALGVLLDDVRRGSGGAFMLKADPAVEVGSAQDAVLRQAGFQRGRGIAFGGVQPSAVMVLDLDAPEEAIFARFKPKWRYNVRLAARKGVEVVEGSGDDLSTFYRLLVETSRRDGFPIRDEGYFRTQWDLLAPRGMLRMWLARVDGIPVAGILCFVFGARVTYVYGASSTARRSVMPNYLVQWTAIRRAMAGGASVYDFRGVSPVQDGRLLEPWLGGLNRFKEGFGTRQIQYVGGLDLPLRPVLSRAWMAAAPTAVRLYRRLSYLRARRDERVAV